MEISDRVKELPPYLFVGISNKIRSKKDEGEEVISFGIGDPDIPTFYPVTEKLKEAIDNPDNHKYPESEGLPEFRQAVSNFYDRRFGVKLNPKTETINLIGAKEGIAHISLALLNPNDIAIIPDPSYPVYDIGTFFAGGKSYKHPLSAKNNWLMNFEDIPSDTAKNAKILWLNYPNNPTGAIATPKFFKDALDFGKEYDIFVLHDACYTEVTYDGYKAPSILQTEGAMDYAAEFHSLSKTANMTGWRIGMASGNSDIINALKKVKENIDSGSPQALQEMGIEALNLPQYMIDENNEIYKKRRDEVVSVLNDVGLYVQNPKAGFYIWAKVPHNNTSAQFAEDLLEKANVVVTPGTGYGKSGEGYIRLSLTTPDNLITKGLGKIKEFMNKNYLGK